MLRYASYVYDPESGLYYCSARYYDPVTRQFTTSDSAKADGEQSVYQYCGGNPVERTDTSGLEWCGAFKYWSYMGIRAAVDVRWYYNGTGIFDVR